MKKTTGITGHRGASGLAPENTLDAFKKNVEVGGSVLELDVRLTRDGKLVCFHDDRLDRITPEKGLVSDWEWEALKDVPVMKTAFNGAYPNARIPLLSEVFAQIPAPNQIVVEIKKDLERPALLVARTMEECTRANALSRIRFISFEIDLLRRVRAWKPDSRGPEPQGVVMAPLGTKANRDQMIEFAKELKAIAIHLNHTGIDEEWTKRVHDAGFLVNAWTVNQEADWERLAAVGVDEVTTDFPDRALAFFKKRDAQA